MTLKEKIQSDFITAMKAKDEVGKRALSAFKAKITEAEKADKNIELTDDGVIKVLNSAMKQRRQSYDDYTKFGRDDLAKSELDELKVLELYLPKQMNEDEIALAIRDIIQSFTDTITNPHVLIGKAIGEFNKKYVGKADLILVKKILTNIVNP